MRSMIFALLLTAALPGHAATACVDGSADGYACSHVDLLHHLTPSELGGSGETLNDLWGWTDADGVEYVLVGMRDGTAFVRLPESDEGTPELLGRLPATEEAAAFKCHHDDACGEGSAWRDLKTYGHYLYVVSEADGHGVQIFDLQRLVGAPAAATVFEEDAHFNGFGHAHNIVINEDSGHAFAVGNGDVGDASDGGLFMLDLSDPLNPVSLGEINLDGYVHDAQCIRYDGPDSDYQGREICFGADEDSLTVFDVADGAANASVIARVAYFQAEYTHQVWLSEDRRHLFLNDELDELDWLHRTRLRVFDVSDLDAIALAAEYYAPTLSIDHNHYTHGRWLYQTNYNAGLRILDVSDPLHPVEAAYFDTQPDTDLPEFEGTWSNYRFPSGRTALSDIRDGLFLVRPQLGAGQGADLNVTMAPGTAAADSLPVQLFLSNAGTVDADEVLLTAHLPPGAAWTLADLPASAECGPTGRVLRCRFARVVAGESLSLLLNAESEVDDPLAIAMAYSREEDANAGDNLASAALAFQSVAPPAPPEESGTGGGGGAFPTAGVVLLWLIRRRWRAGWPAARGRGRAVPPALRPASPTRTSAGREWWRPWRARRAPGPSARR